jgi:transcriptional regulator with XRE-family HTH domain
MTNPNFDNIFARRIRLLRQLAGTDLQSTARAMGWSPGNLSAFETGHRPNPTLRIIRKFAEFYRVPPATLIEDDPAEPPHAEN